MYSLLALLLILILCDSITIGYERDHRDIVTKSKFELAPIHITCEVDDIAVISAPTMNSKEVLYYLYKPNGDALRLDFPKSKAGFTKPETGFTPNNTQVHKEKHQLTDYGKIIVKYINKDIKAIYPKRNYKIINANFELNPSKSDNIVDGTEMMGTDFMMGPLSEEYHGNWVLSVYCKDVDGSWVEVFQVITIELVELVPMMAPSKVKLEEGSTFNLRFAYPIEGLQSCELTAPSSTFDRYFDRSRIDLDRCGFVVPNVTKSDEGAWKVTGVGKIVYEGIVNLRVGNKVT